MIKGARISDCGKYRYTLSRIWEARGTPCVFVMLNPSTADADNDDPTIRRCIGFARRENCGSLLVVNLFALRATSPRDMLGAIDPVGPENDAVLLETFAQARSAASPVIAAWGVHGFHRGRAAAVCRIAANAGVGLDCLGLTTNVPRAPRHPLYVKGDAERIAYRKASVTDTTPVRSMEDSSKP
jgi:hypothetical protein